MTHGEIDACFRRRLRSDPAKKAIALEQSVITLNGMEKSGRGRSSSSEALPAKATTSSVDWRSTKSGGVKNPRLASWPCTSRWRSLFVASNSIKTLKLAAGAISMKSRLGIFA